MNARMLDSSPIGRMVPITISAPDGTSRPMQAYIPDPLPAEPSLSAAANAAAFTASIELARLDQASRQLPNPELIARMAVRREASATNALEGTYAPFDEVLETDYVDKRQFSSAQREIFNSIQATDLAVTSIRGHGLTRGLLGELQLTLVGGTADEAYDSGDLRQRQVAIGANARFVPPPPGPVLEGGFDEWLRWSKASPPLPDVIRAAIGHYQFETLHPYNNGNGRLGRLVVLMQFLESGLLAHPVLDLSVALNSSRDEYINQLYEVSVTGDFSAWVIFFAEALTLQARLGLRRVHDLDSWREATRALLLGSGKHGAVALQTIDHLVGYPVVDAPTVSEFTRKTPAAASAALQQLCELGILERLPLRGRTQPYICRGVLRIING